MSPQIRPALLQRKKLFRHLEAAENCYKETLYTLSTLSTWIPGLKERLEEYQMSKRHMKTRQYRAAMCQCNIWSACFKEEETLALSFILLSL